MVKNSYVDMVVGKSKATTNVSAVEDMMEIEIVADEYVIDKVEYCGMGLDAKNNITNETGSTTRPKDSKSVGRLDEERFGSWVIASNRSNRPRCMETSVATSKEIHDSGRGSRVVLWRLKI
ncbi:hypothetical protein V6N12_007461 [Hibiscus sabdariffa]|uniref:Uncharacterized protein n=1 Tax=Hibiscus sabdariffa TaxID=183260 RepID=A0ABR2F1W9_9ROSI